MICTQRENTWPKDDTDAPANEDNKAWIENHKEIQKCIQTQEIRLYLIKSILVKRGV